MPLVMHQGQATEFGMHGSTFRSFVAPARGSEQLCAWQFVVAPETAGTAHRVTHEEVLLVLAGAAHVRIDDTETEVGEADVVRVPAGATLRIDTTSAGCAHGW